MKSFASHQRTSYLSKKLPVKCMSKYYKFWVDCTLHGESFEVYYDIIDGRGLGIRATKLVSLGTLSLEMVGFLETIEYSLYA